MTAPHIVDPAGLVGEALADADAVVGAEYGRATPSRLAQRNGYRQRDPDTRMGTIDVAVPKLRKGTYFPEWLLERRKRAESALITVVADCYLAGVSTRRMDKLVKQLGSTPCPSRRSRGWPPTWTRSSKSSAAGPWARSVRSRSSPPMR